MVSFGCRALREGAHKFLRHCALGLNDVLREGGKAPQRLSLLVVCDAQLVRNLAAVGYATTLGLCCGCGAAGFVKAVPEGEQRAAPDKRSEERRESEHEKWTAAS